MPLDKFLIAPLRSGLELDKDPWLIMDDAWEVLDNVHVWRGKVKKRFGAVVMNDSKAAAEKQLFSRFRINIGTTAAVTGNFGPVNVPGSIFKIGQMFSIGTTIFTVYQNGAMYSTGNATGTYNTATGAVSIVGNNENPLTPVYFYPTEPVMKLATYEQPDINDEDLVGFDTQFAYFFVKASGWQILGPTPPAANSALWTGTNGDFFWTTNWRGLNSDDFLLFVTNNVVADQIKYWDGVAGIWKSISPVYNPTTNDVIHTSRIIIPFKERLLLMNTTERITTGLGVVNSTFQNRIRYSKVGSPIADDSFHEVDGLGDFIDAPVKEAIISAEFIKDRLIVFFERSTWELVYTGNQILPFVFQKLNTELGVESMNSIIPFDKVVLGMGSTGIHACNGMNVDRIDQKIPDEVFDISNRNDGPERVAGIRDYLTEEVYWSYSSSEEAGANTETFPNRVLVYNYVTNSWAINDDSITAFGYYQNEGDIFWQDLDEQWQESSDRWNDPSLTSLFRNIVAGNQQGFTFIIDNEKSSNSISLSITNIVVAANIVTITVIEHNLNVGDFIFIQNVQSDNTLENLNDLIWRVNSVADSDTFSIVIGGLSGNYKGAGTIQRVSEISLISKRYNFYNTVGKKIQIPRIDFLVDSTENGEIGFRYFSSFSDLDLQEEADVQNVSLGDNILVTSPTADVDFESSQIKIWRSLYPILEGETIQYALELTDDQILDPDIAFSDFTLHAILFSARSTDDLGT